VRISRMLFFKLLACCLLSTAEAGEDVRRGETLPVVNVKYDFPATDMSIGGPQFKRFQESAVFKKRGQHIAERINHDGEVLTDFLRAAVQNLDKLTLAFQRALSSSKTASPKDKSVQLFEVAGSSSANERFQIVPPGVKAGLYGEIVSHSDFELNLEPPEVQTREAQDQLDGLMEFEEAKHSASEAALAAEQRHMLNVEKSALRGLVHSSFAPDRPSREAKSVQLLEADKRKIVAQSLSSLPGPEGLYGNIGGQSDVELNLAPPETGLHDTQEALDTMLKAEEAKHESSADLVAAAKQRMLNVEKSVLRELVRSAILPLSGRIKVG